MKEMRCLHCGSNEFGERHGKLYCLYCGSVYLKRPEDEEILLSNAYQALQFMNFAEAEERFERILEQNDGLPEAHWGYVCARHGIRFEQDFDGSRIPTCCLPEIESFSGDAHYLRAVELSDAETAAWYQDKAAYIDRVKEVWHQKAKKLAPYDIFISYKDSDRSNGIERTQDSYNALELFSHLQGQGYRVFYSREALRDVIGEKYEPYIFHALSTAKVMIVYASNAEYVSSTWMRNEWQRYSQKIKQGEKDPGSLIVICDGFPPSELPAALHSVQVLNGTSKTCYMDLDHRLHTLFSPSDKNEEKVRTKEKPPKAQPSRNDRKPFRRTMVLLLALLLVALGSMTVFLLNDSNEYSYDADDSVSAETRKSTNSTASSDQESDRGTMWYSDEETWASAEEPTANWWETTRVEDPVEDPTTDWWETTRVEDPVEDPTADWWETTQSYDSVEEPTANEEVT